MSVRGKSMSGSAPKLVVEAVDLFERDVRLRMPFRFGVVTLREAPQAFARARIRLADGRVAEGMAAELLAPKWFDKNPALSNENNFDQLRASLGIARGLSLDGTAATAFGHFGRHYRDQIEQGAQRQLIPLVASYGPALIDRAVLDALCRALGLPFHEVVRQNLAGIAPGDLCPDLAGFDIDAFLAGLRPSPTIEARHTVGLLDPITRAEQTERVGDGLPEALDEVVAAYGHRWFKLKVAGDIAADIDRLTRIATRGDRRIELLAKEYQLLEYLLRHAGQVVTRTMLLEAIWDYSFNPGTNVIDVHVSRLRAKVAGEGEAPMIHTVRGAGYRLDAG